MTKPFEGVDDSNLWTFKVQQDFKTLSKFWADEVEDSMEETTNVGMEIFTIVISKNNKKKLKGSKMLLLARLKRTVLQLERKNHPHESSILEHLGSLDPNF